MHIIAAIFHLEGGFFGVNMKGWSDYNRYQECKQTILSFNVEYIL